MSKTSRFRGCLEKQYGTHAQVLLKSASQNVYHSHWSVARKLCLKKSLLLTCKILGLLFNKLAVDEKYLLLNRDNLTIWSRCGDADDNSAWAHLPCRFSKSLLKQVFLDIYLTTFSESVSLEIQKLLGSSFFPKNSTFNLNFINAANNSEKFFCFWDICIWIGIVQLSLWGTRYFLSAANVFTGSSKIFHVNKGDLFQLNFLDSDQWIW